MGLPGWRIAGAVAITASAAFMGWPSRAVAHAELVSSVPAANASLTQSPPRVTLVFSETLDGRNPTIHLSDEAGVEVPIGQPALDATGTTLLAELPHLEPALYTVTYQVTSALDGHVSRGLFAFLVDPTVTRAPPELLPPAPATPPDLPTSLARWLTLAMGLGLFGTAIFWLLSARASGSAPWLLLSAMGWASFLGLGLYLSMAADEMSAPGGLFFDFAAPFGDTPFANAMRLAQAGVLLASVTATAALGLSATRRRDRPASGSQRGGLMLVGVAGAIGLAGWALGSHPAALGGPVFAVFDWLHLVAVGAWLGALPGLLVLAARDRRRPTQDHTAGEALSRHSRVALAAAPLVVLSGLANSSLVLGDARGLLATDYGNQLLAKAILFSAALGLGGVNFFLVRARSWRRLTMVSLAELGIGATAVLLAAMLANGQPAASRPMVVIPPAGGATQLSAVAGESRVHLAVIVAEPGIQRYQLSVRDRASGAYRTDIQRAFLIFEAPAALDLPPSRITLDATDLPWLWTTSGAYTPVVGEWRMEVVVRRAGVRDESVQVGLAVREVSGATIVPQQTSGVQVPRAVTWAWGLVPSGGWGWLPAVLALAGLAALFWIGRKGSADRLRVARASVAVVAVVLGLVVGSRDLVRFVDSAPYEAAGRANPVAPTAESVAGGQRIYRANCSACHAVNGEDLVTVIRADSDGALEWRIATGTAATRMPGFASTLSSDDRWHLVNYLRTLTRD